MRGTTRPRQALVPAIEKRYSARETARAYEATLPAEQRKLLGQFFTGMPLGKLLAHLALDSSTKTVLDPMAGHGDLLDATWEAAETRHIIIERSDGIEIDERTASVCRERLTQIIGTHAHTPQRIISGNSFAIDVMAQLPDEGYDLVITNPPYVRYQARKGFSLANDKVRTALGDIVNDRVPSLEKDTWQGLVMGYSGLADLSVPCWLLSGLLVRPGGRLALVVPATWRSRDYADLIQYLLLRCFTVEYVVEDTHPGWFNDALIRTHLIVAKRLPSDTSVKPLRERTAFSLAEWVQIAPEAADGVSLVGRAFEGESPEAVFASWLHGKSKGLRHGIQRHIFDSEKELESLESRARSKNWFQRLEGLDPKPRLFSSGNSTRLPALPDAVRDIVPGDIEALCTLEDAGIRVGQGLRTGCNQFFYLEASSTVDGHLIGVTTSPALGRNRFIVPQEALRPVIRRQSEIPALRAGNTPPGRVLNLLGWVLPEDAEVVSAHFEAYRATGQDVPQIMPEELARLVRLAAVSRPRGTANVKRIPDLSAVRTNVRNPRNNNSTPRFWYMLPAFAPRHLPAVFVPRVNHNRPWAEANLDPPILIDANFSSLWPVTRTWTRFGLKALINSVWCRTLMEALGTPLGGGALKLEASHLRRMPIPRLSDKELVHLHRAGKELTPESHKIHETIDAIVLRRVLGAEAEERSLLELSAGLEARSRKLRLERKRRLLP